MSRDANNHSIPPDNRELKELIKAVRELTARVDRLEGRVNTSVPMARAAVTPITRRPSLESRFGSQYLNRAGILALLVGASFAVHWAFTNNWIGPWAIIVIGLLGGIAVFALGQWFISRGYSAFGVSLQGLGLGALYLDLWAGFQIYRIVPFAPAILGMVVITAASVATALWQDSKPLAIFAFLGGFATPFLLSTGRNDQTEFFLFLVVLAAGMLATLALKPWTSLLVASFCGCFVVVLAWFVSYYNAREWISALFYVTVIFGVFVAANLLLDRHAGRVPLLLPFMTASYLAAAYDTAPDHIATIEMLTCLGLIVSSRAVKRRFDPWYTTVGLACFALAVPAHFDNRWTTSFLWIGLGLVLMFIGFYTNLDFIRWDALVLVAITVLKVFILDLARLATGYRILAMTVLGVALLAISFTYQSDWLRVRRAQRK